MGGSVNPILGSFINGVVSNRLSRNDPVKGALINASALAGSGNLAGAMPSPVTPPTPVIPGIDGGPSAAFYNPALSTPAATSQYQIPGLVGGPSAAFSNPAIMPPPPIQGLVGGPSNVFSNPYATPAASVSNIPAPIVEMGTNAAQSTDPSYWNQFTKFTQQNPVLAQMGFATAKDMLTPEQQQISPAPVVPVQAKGQLKNYDPISYMDPYRQSAVNAQPISLLG